ncbi:MAG: hypothetical protein RL662_2431 [Bacteroidota bacterium]|jgi:hypothetical protein
MKKINLILLFMLSGILGLYAQGNRIIGDKYCDFGVKFEMSNTPGWGYGEPVILEVEPFSLAEKAGLKIGDVIMEINSTATYLRNRETISSWLMDSKSPEIKLTIRNLDTYFKEYSIQRKCKSVNAISEFNLASAYSFYSIEDTNQRAFSLPMRVDPNMNIDFSDYRTFNFAVESTATPEIDQAINALFEKALIERGLVKNTNDPDMIVQSYYTFQPNVKYDARTNSKGLKSWRYDTDKKIMAQLPILSGEDQNGESKGQYIIELGLRFFDKKYIDKNKLTQIWDCKTRDLLTAQITLPEYARLHAPLMLMQYPVSIPKSIAKYVVKTKAFNYTGMNFDINDMRTITDVDAASPAHNAGLKSGDVVKQINNIDFDFDITQLESSYRRFLIETMPLRDKKTKFIDANGFPDCMYWDKTKYPQIIEIFRKEDIYAPCFSYLYAFRPYVSGSSTKAAIEVEVKTTGGTTKKVRIIPQIQKSVSILAL